MKFLVLGSEGMAGHTISTYLFEQGHIVDGFDRKKTLKTTNIVKDAKNVGSLKDLLQSSKQAHERPEGMDEGTLIMSGLKKESILQSIDVIVSQFSREKRVTKIVNDYDVDNFSIKVVPLNK